MQSLSVYIDTLVICTASAMMVLIFYVQDPELAQSLGGGMALVQMAVNNSVGEVGIHFMTFAIFAFAFSSLIGNYFYAESNFLFITKNRWALLIFRLFCLAAVIIGAVNNLSLAWAMSDIFMGFMALINLVAIVLLGKWALAALDDYTAQRKAGKDPVFLASSIPGLPEVQCWKQDELEDIGPKPIQEYIDEALDPDFSPLK